MKITVASKQPTGMSNPIYIRIENGYVFQVTGRNTTGQHVIMYQNGNEYIIYPDDDINLLFANSAIWFLLLKMQDNINTKDLIEACRYVLNPEPGTPFDSCTFVYKGVKYIIKKNNTRELSIARNDKTVCIGIKSPITRHTLILRQWAMCHTPCCLDDIRELLNDV